MNSEVMGLGGCEKGKFVVTEKMCLSRAQLGLPRLISRF